MGETQHTRTVKDNMNYIKMKTRNRQMILTPEVASRTFMGGRDMTRTLDDMETMLVGNHLVASGFVNIPRSLSDLAFKNCVSEISISMMIDDRHLEQAVRSERLVDGLRYKWDGSWEHVKMYPNSVLIFQTDRMCRQYVREMEIRNKNSGSVQSHCIDMTYTYGCKDHFVCEFENQRLCDETYARENVPKKIELCKGQSDWHDLGRCRPSNIVFVGNFDQDSHIRLCDLVGNCDSYEEGDLIPLDPVRVTHIPFRWEESLHDMNNIRDRWQNCRLRHKSPRNTSEYCEARTKFVDTCFVTRPDGEEDDPRPFLRSADFLQSCPSLDTSDRPRYIGITFLAAVTDILIKNDDKQFYDNLLLVLKKYTCAQIEGETGCIDTDDCFDTDDDEEAIDFEGTKNDDSVGEMEKQICQSFQSLCQVSLEQPEGHPVAQVETDNEEIDAEGEAEEEIRSSSFFSMCSVL
jgi:hypothetical protein